MKKLLSLLLVVALLCCCVGCSPKPADNPDTTTTTTVTTTTTQKTNVITTKPTSTQVTSTTAKKSNTTAKPTTTTTAPQANPASDFKYAKCQDGKSIGITAYLGTAKDVVIPDTIDGLPVTTIGIMAFFGKDIVSIQFPDSVETIFDDAFGSCKQLKTVTLGGGIKDIRSCAFANCTSLEHIDLPEELIVNSLFRNVFQGTPAFYELKHKYEQYFLFIS